MLTIHHLGVSQSDRIPWLCEELGLPYALVRHERDPATRLAPAAYRALHPAGTAPVIEEDGVVLAESAAIVDWLLARHGGGRLRPAPDDPAFADFLFWYHYLTGSLMPAMMGLLGEGPIRPVMADRVARGLAMLDGRVARHPWLAGAEFTAADIMAAFPLTTVGRFVALDLAPYPALPAYVARLTGRPAYRRAMARAEPEAAIPPDGPGEGRP